MDGVQKSAQLPWLVDLGGWVLGLGLRPRRVRVPHAPASRSTQDRESAAYHGLVSAGLHVACAGSGALAAPHERGQEYHRGSQEDRTPELMSCRAQQAGK